MHRILVVEDIELTIDQLSQLMQEEMEEMEIVVAKSVEEALAAVENAHNLRQPFCAVVLDFFLPKKWGGQPSVDESVCDRVTQMPWGDLLIAHVTAFDDPAIEKHLAESHAQKGWPTDLWFRKEPGWTRRLLQELKGYLMVEELRIFRPPDECAERGPSGSDAWSDTSLSLRMSRLVRRIQLYWDDLDPRIRSQVFEHFDIDETVSPIRVSLR
jgi:CheY-like chemotaxis protein